jgi:hypothetical protein
MGVRKDNATKAKKDTKAPKRALTAYIIYSQVLLRLRFV